MFFENFENSIENFYIHNALTNIIPVNVALVSLNFSFRINKK